MGDNCPDEKSFVPSSKKENTLRKNLDKVDQKEDGKLYQDELEKDNRDFVEQVRHMIDHDNDGGESADCVFKAIESTAQELCVHPMDIIDILKLPAINDIIIEVGTGFHQYENVGKLAEKSGIDLKKATFYPNDKARKDMADLENDDKFKIYKDYYVSKKVYKVGANDERIKTAEGFNQTLY